jgi:hypothetical protein
VVRCSRIFGGLFIAGARPQGTIFSSFAAAVTEIALKPPILNFIYRTALAFEPLAPTAINLYLTRTFNNWKSEKIITAYTVHTKRIHRFHYRIFMDFTLTSVEVHYILNHWLPRQVKQLTRR